MAHVVAVANQKGGVGKTTTTINLAASLALADQRVLLVDVDPQSNLTSGVGQRGKASPAGTIYQALTTPIAALDCRKFIVPTAVDRMQLLPSDRNLTGAEIELVTLERREERLRILLNTIRDEYDYILIDCPPSLGLLTLNALVAANAVIIPLHCEYFALEGLADLVGTMRRVRAALNPSLDIEGVLLTMYDARLNLCRQVADEAKEYFGARMFTITIPRNVRLAEAPSFGKPIILYDVQSVGAKSYLAVAQELIHRVEQGAPPSPSLPAIESLPPPEVPA